MSKKVSITEVSGVSVGHWTHPEAATGCTVVLCPEGAVASVDVRGGAPATRETDVLRSGNLVDRVHAVLLSGGSAYGLDAATGVMLWLEEHGHGFPVTTGVVPIVPAACVYDLGIGRGDVRPDASAGYDACAKASTGPVAEGSVGGGTGATVGKALGMQRALKGGIGTAAEMTASGITIGALVVVNCWGEVVDPDTATVIGTDAVLSKEQAYRLAVIAQAGLARAIRPVHTPVDGDAIFALATCRNDTETDVLQLGAMAARAVERSCVRAVLAATGLAGVPSAAEWTAQR
jgi:L-aminopeptidase/D-esterase-like protein